MAIGYDKFVFGYALCFVIGLVGYFTLEIEPNLSLCMAGTIGAGLCWFLGRRHIKWRFIFGCLFWMTASFLVASYRTYDVTAPVLKYPLKNIFITGTITETSVLMRGQKIVLDVHEIQGFPKQKTPARVRLDFNYILPNLPMGSKVTLNADLYPRPLPAEKGGYSFARTAWFQQIGAIGTIRHIESVMPDSAGIQTKLEQIRSNIAHRLLDVLSYHQAQVAIPLIIGDQKIISHELYDLYRHSGITHILSVSGFHLTLLAGFIFFVIRFGLAFFPAIALRVNTKKTAAFTALIIVTGYLLISGMQIPAIRSYLMIALALCALLINRQPISVRFVVLAAFMMLIWRPEFIVNIGFQLSFLAVLALVGFVEPCLSYYKEHLSSQKGMGRKLFFIVLSMMAVDILATIATAPVVLYHFNQFPVYGFLGNLTTNILFSFLIMPLLFLGVVLMPLHGDAPFLKVAGYFLDIIADICRFISELPHAVLYTPSFSETGFVIIAFGLIFTFILVGYYRFIGVLCIMIGCLCCFNTILPDVRVVGVGDKYVMSIQAADDFWTVDPDNPSKTVSFWMQHSGIHPRDSRIKAIPETLPILYIKNKKIAFDLLFCGQADISFLSARYPLCSGDVITASDLKRYGTHSVFIKNNHIRIDRAADQDKNRPWHF